MKGGTRVALAVALGYFLGRTRKMKVALMLAGAGATGRLPTSSRGLLREGVRRFGESEEIGKLTDSVRGELVDAAKRAAVTAASSSIDALTERIEGVGEGVSSGLDMVAGHGDDEDSGAPAAEAAEPAENHESEEAEGAAETAGDGGEDAAEEKPERRRRAAATPRTRASSARSGTTRTRRPAAEKSTRAAEAPARARVRSGASDAAPVRRTGR